MLIFAGNSIPPIWNGGDKKAFVERMIPVQFESPVADKDKIPNILDKINMEYIIKEAVARLYAFLENNKVFTQPRQSRTMRHDILSDADILHAFVEDCDTSDKGYKIHTKNFYEVFKVWAEANGHSSKEISQNLFTRRLKEMGQGMGFVGKKVAINGTCSLAGFVGIKPPSLESLGYWGTVCNQDGFPIKIEQ
jgi:phage/plasmid-associated DNA primase